MALANLNNMPFRGPTIAFAIILFGFGLWILSVEFFRADVQKLPADAQSASLAASKRKDAGIAASIGFWRGDLWAESAYTYAPLLWQEHPESDQISLNQARRSAETAISEAPHNAGVWLLLAGLSARFHWDTPSGNAALKMSYYTGPSEISMIPLRMSLATKSNALSDAEVQQFVQRDLHIILSERPELKPAIIAAYRAASHQGQDDFQRLIRDIDPAFAQTLQTPIAN
jgi:hypothetical protein